MSIKKEAAVSAASFLLIEINYLVKTKFLESTTFPSTFNV